MATQQYIGARYVPVFGRKDETSIQWNNSKPYEPLTIVLHEGNSYTSRQYVPSGVAITNTDYWALTGNYNGQIEIYRDEVNSFSDAIIELARQQDYVNNALPVSYFGSPNTVKAYVDSNSTKLFNNKNIFVFGDSWAGAYVSDGVFSPQTFINSLNVFSQCLKDNKGGAGFSTAVDGISFKELANNLTINNNISVVLIVGGANDGVTVNSSDITTVISTLKTKFPNATLYFAQNIFRISRGNILGAMYKRDLEVAKNGVMIIDAWKDFWNYTPYYGSDNAHLTVEGYQAFYASCISTICGGKTFKLPQYQYNISNLITNINENISIDNALMLVGCGFTRLQFRVTSNSALTSSTELFRIPYRYFPRVSTVIYKGLGTLDNILLYAEEDSIHVFNENSVESGIRKTYIVNQYDGDVNLLLSTGVYPQTL